MCVLSTTKPTDDPNPYAHLSLPPDVNTMLQGKDRYVEALNIIINIIKSNPLIVNKFVIAEYQLLLKLIQLLTNADEVQIVEKEIDPGCVCSCTDPVLLIDKIYVIKNNQSYIFKQTYTNAVRLLDEHKISIKMTIMK